ncbi:MAG TPA: hypothetical protein VJL27_02905 [Patescibacteria group bacterium]|nr:hypothetical protein [Patescibacteria group bacterium]
MGLIPRDYHNPQHTLSVLFGVREIGERAVDNTKIHSRDIELLEVAAAFHDIEQDMGSGANETQSTQIATHMMTQTGCFEDDEIDLVRAMILSTTVNFDTGFLKQLVLTQFGYPTSIMADADLATLGASTSVYWDAAERLLFELSRTREPSVEQRRAFLENQVLLLENHRFFTEEATSLYSHQPANLGSTRDALRKLA